MGKENEVETAAKILSDRGMNYDLAKKNLLECDRYFIDKLISILK